MRLPHRWRCVPFGNRRQESIVHEIDDRDITVFGIVHLIPSQRRLPCTRVPDRLRRSAPKLLWDVVRVVTRLIGRIAKALNIRRIEGFCDRRRAAHRRMYEIQRMTTRQRQGAGSRQTATTGR
jgi:hypothetical protein